MNNHDNGVSLEVQAAMRKEKAVVLGLLLILLAEVLVTAINGSNSQVIPGLNSLNPVASDLSSDATKVSSLGLLKSGNVDISVAFGVRNSGLLQNFINLRKKSHSV
jgi:hypothetical protein